MGIFVGLIITAISYLAVPLIMLASNGGKFPKKKANKIAIWNSVIVGLLFLILAIATEATSNWTPLPAILYYGINFAILVEKTSKENNLTKEDNVSYNKNISNDVPVVKSNVEIKSSINFCRKCGNRVTNDSVFCNKCGSKITWN